MQITPRGLILSPECNSAKQTVSARRQTFRLAERIKLYKSAHLHRKFRAFYCGCCSRLSSPSFLFTLSSTQRLPVCMCVLFQEAVRKRERYFYCCKYTHHSSEGGRARARKRRTGFVSRFISYQQRKEPTSFPITRYIHIIKMNSDSGIILILLLAHRRPPHLGRRFYFECASQHGAAAERKDAVRRSAPS
jgi:hypothetical protein